MTRRLAEHLLLAASVVAGFAQLALAEPPRALSFEQRVAADRAIQEVYRAARVWPNGSSSAKSRLDAAMTEEALRGRVVDLLRKSNALATRWGRAPSASELEAELRRMAVATRAPETLKALFSSLGDDPILEAETLARRALVEREVRDAYAWDRELHASTRARAEAAMRGARRTPEAARFGGAYRERVVRWDGSADAEELAAIAQSLQAAFGRAPDATRETAGTVLKTLPVGRWSALSEDVDAFRAFRILDAGRDVVQVAGVEWAKTPFDVWWPSAAGGFEAAVSPLDRPVAPQDVAADHSCATAPPWVPTPAPDAPAPRRNAVSVSTGAEFLVYGGEILDLMGPVWTATGAVYDPAIDAWRPMPLPDPSQVLPRECAAVWTGTEMIVWGGRETSGAEAAVDRGGRYDPALDAWTPVATSGAPSARSLHSAVWTGTAMIVWGGTSEQIVESGARYDPASNSWTPIASGGTARYAHTAVWTGSRMIAWGGWGAAGGLGGPAAIYDPVANAWSFSGAPLPGNDPPPIERINHTAVWTGSRMIVWGGQNPTHASVKYGDGAGYDPALDRWFKTATSGAPSVRDKHTAVWTGSRMVVWGGTNSCCFLNSGGEYEPATNSWTSTFGPGAPAVRAQHAAALLGSATIIWGGMGTGSRTTNTGATYCTCSFYRDQDGDGYGDPASLLRDCAFVATPPGYVRDYGDCDDGSAGVHPEGTDTSCDGVDQNCSGAADEGYLPVATSCGAGACAATGTSACVGGVETNACVPGLPTPETCNGIDDDCNGVVDDAPSGVAALTAEKVAAVAQWSWTPLFSAAGYDVTRGGLGSLRAAAGDYTASVDACIAADLAATTVGDAAAPPAADGFWYLVRGRNCAGAASYDEGAASQPGSRDPGIDAAPLACP